MNNSNENKTTTEAKSTKKLYKGDRAPMVSMTMLKTSRAITGALGRIEVRRSWINEQKGILMESFNSNDPIKKQDAFVTAERLASSIPGLNEKEQALKDKLAVVQQEELAQLKDLEFPEFSI